MRYSIREVFGYAEAEGSPTGELLESVGLQSPTSGSAPAEGTRSEVDRVSRVIERAIETGALDGLVEARQRRSAVRPGRDDLALQRWREMAGLSSGEETSE